VSDDRARFYEVVRRIPSGRVATYGEVAALAGRPGRARQVGYALAALRDASLPWHRVLNARGEVSRRSDPACEALQRQLLEREGVGFDAAGRVSLAVHGLRARGVAQGGARSGRRAKGTR